MRVSATVKACRLTCLLKPREFAYYAGMCKLQAGAVSARSCVLAKGFGRPKPLVHAPGRSAACEPDVPGLIPRGCTLRCASKRL